MQVMFVLIGFSLLVALIFLGLYLWAVRTGQFDDKVTPSIRMLFDDESVSNDDKQEEVDKDKSDHSK